MEEPFSKRHGYQPPEKPITIRYEAPYELRGVISDIAYKVGFRPNKLRSSVCHSLRKRPDSNNWSDPNVDGEIQRLMDDCEWYQVYDVIEGIYRAALMRPQMAEEFETEVNSYFRSEGIGWQLRSGRIEIRGEEGFENVIPAASAILDQSGLGTASKEIHEAIGDLSRRPKPDITGAIQHAMAGLECVAREMTGDRKATLGDILNRHPDLLPKPLDNAIQKIWGFSSEVGRHLREGREPRFEEAELVAGLCACVSMYLIKISACSVR